MEAVKAYELELELRQIRELRKAIELKMKDLEYAESLLTATKSERKIYRSFADLLIEVTKDEAIEHIESLRLAYRRELERLKQREKEIMEELVKLRS